MILIFDSFSFLIYKDYKENDVQYQVHCFCLQKNNWPFVWFMYKEINNLCICGLGPQFIYWMKKVQSFLLYTTVLLQCITVSYCV